MRPRDRMNPFQAYAYTPPHSLQTRPPPPTTKVHACAQLARATSTICKKHRSDGPVSTALLRQALSLSAQDALTTLPLVKHADAKPETVPETVSETVLETSEASTDKFKLYRAVPASTSLVPQEAAFVVFDTETSGLGARDLVVQIAYLVCAADGAVLQSHQAVLRLPHGVHMSRRSIQVHGITYDRLRREGIDASSQLKRLELFHKHTQRTQPKLKWVAHNAAFDRRMIRQTARRHGMVMPSFESNDDHFFCTLQASAHQLQNHHVDGVRRSRLKNVELYRYLHGNESPPDDIRLHDALGDCRVTAWNYAAGTKRWHWK